MTEVTNINAPRDLIKGLEELLALARKGEIRGAVTYYVTTNEDPFYTYAFFGYTALEVMGVCARMTHIANEDWDKTNRGSDDHA